MDELRISKRLQTAAELVIPGNRVADIGTDHGYLPIYLIQKGISPQVIAMDVRKGPLSKAQGNMIEYGVSDQVNLRLSDGLEQLGKSEVDTVTMCGMGGRLMKQILTNGMSILTDGMQLILSPQSELAEFRIFLKNNNIHIVNELMLKEEQQFYVIMDCRFCKMQQSIENRYGKILLERQDPILKELLLRELELNHRLIHKLELSETNKSVMVRIEALKDEGNLIQQALKYYD